MIPKIESAQYVGDYRIRLRFADGREGEVDLESEPDSCIAETA